MAKVYEQYVGYLYLALESRYGVVISSSNTKLSQAHLYQARAALKFDEEMLRLQFRPDPLYPSQFIWIIKGPKQEGAPNGTPS